MLSQGDRFETFLRRSYNMTIFSMGDATIPQQVARHPLDPLSEEEINQTTHILNASGKITPRMRILAYSLHEPPKGDVLAFRPGQQVQREVFVVIRDHERQLTIESIVSLTEQKIRTWRERHDVQPALTYPEVFAAMQTAFDDAAFHAALAKRGITDLSPVVLFPFTAGNWGPEDAAERGRLIRLQASISEGSEDNYYARPIEGVIVTVELDSMTVRVDDHGVVPVPQHSGNYTATGITAPENIPYFPQGPRKDLKLILITQPQGVSFNDEGYQVNWQK